jgi:hypothetical protein
MHESFAAPEAKRDGVAEPRSQGESGDPFGRNEPTGHSEPRGPLISPQRETLHHIAGRARAASWSAHSPAGKR